DEFDACADENSTKNESANDSPEKNPMLLLFRNGEVVEDHKKNEKIVDAEGQLQHVSRDKFQAGLMSMPVEQQYCESPRQSDIHRAPQQRPSKTHRTSRAVKDLEVEDQHPKREDVEENPEEQQGELSWQDTNC